MLRIRPGYDWKEHYSHFDKRTADETSRFVRRFFSAFTTFIAFSCFLAGSIQGYKNFLLFTSTGVFLYTRMGAAYCKVAYASNFPADTSKPPQKSPNNAISGRLTANEVLARLKHAFRSDAREIT